MGIAHTHTGKVRAQPDDGPSPVTIGRKVSLVFVGLQWQRCNGKQGLHSKTPVKDTFFFFQNLLFEEEVSCPCITGTKIPNIPIKHLQRALVKAVLLVLCR